eukprot:Hpha_TRINITY_DN1962_c0_g1::TRINITY_DN1962_c0_g1_i1::g.30911::m.30911
MARRAFALCLLYLQAEGCAFARSGLPLPDDAFHRGLSKDNTYPVLPRPVTTQNNAFVQNDLQAPIEEVSGNNKTLLQNLNEFANGSDEYCYWAWQALPPPRGGPTILAPKRGYWDVSDGHNDQDIEWVQAYGEVAVARLHSRIEKNGPVVGAICSMGSVIAKRRCDNGASNVSKCIPAITNGAIQWPMAVSMWKVGHPDLAAANTDWRASSSTGHKPNIEWVAHTPGTSRARKWAGEMPNPGEISPASMPQSPFPTSKAVGWGSPKIAKVVKCADIPEKFRYHVDVNYYCDHMPSPTSSVSTVDEAYAVWTNLVGLWPPVKPCEDDQAGLDKLLTMLQIPTLVGQNCSVVYPVLQHFLPNFDCDNSDFTPKFRNVCCSQCGSKPIPDVPKPAPGPGTPQASCTVCKHVYDADRDGGGKAFADLPDTWRCPVCGAPKAAYVQTDGGVWVHEHKD